jgi:hypothetical protein
MIPVYLCSFQEILILSPELKHRQYAEAIIRNFEANLVFLISKHATWQEVVAQ